MATSNFYVVQSLSLTIFLVLLTKANSTETVSFTFNKFKPSQPNLILQGDAVVTSLGFATSFSVIVKVPNKTRSSNGFAFFIATIDTVPQTGGGFLSLFNNQSYNKSMQTVPVEFDTYQNPWDSQNRHIGIDVNTIKSIKTALWGLSNGQVAEILVTFDASTNFLVASLVHPSRKTSYILSDVVDLKCSSRVGEGSFLFTPFTIPVVLDKYRITATSDRVTRVGAWSSLRHFVFMSK
ncbi:Lectin protein [Spatholobus suberectus]|nr:Lectin protein [Spatholobus suberectus]